MTRDQVRFLVSGVLFGFLVGYLVAFGVHQSHVKDEAAPVPAAGNMGMSDANAPRPSGGMPGGPAAGGAGGGSEETMTRVFAEIQGLKDAIQKNPKDVGALVRLANFYQDAGKFEPAIDYYRQALALTPDDVNARTDLGICLRELGKTDEALAEFQRSVTIDPKHWQTWLNIGVVNLFDKNDPETAASAFGRLEEINPSFQDLPALKEAVRKARAQGGRKAS
jgi:hypothetical protein